MALLSPFSNRRVMPATNARQGRMGRDVFWVLVISTTLAALALFGAWTWRADDLSATEASNGRQSADASTFSASDPAPVAQSAQEPGAPAAR